MGETIAVTGASGLVGRHVVARLRGEGTRVLRLVRGEPEDGDDVRWDPAAGTLDAARLAGVDGAVHLAGETIAARWTDARRRRIRESRVKGTELLARTLAGLDPRPRVLVQASAVGFYGDRGEEPVDERDGPGRGFLAEVTRAWEAASAPAEATGIRVARLRFGVVLSREGGALRQLLPPFRAGVGGPIGSGRQWMPWISLDDVVGVIVRALRDPRLKGPVNAVAGSTRNADFARTLGRVLHRPALLPVPGFVLRLLYGEMADETLLGGQRVSPRVLSELGHTFHHPTLEEALRAALAPPER